MSHAARIQVIPSTIKIANHDHFTSKPPIAGAAVKERLTPIRLSEIDLVRDSGSLCAINATLLAGRILSDVIDMISTVKAIHGAPLI